MGFFERVRRAMPAITKTARAVAKGLEDQSRAGTSARGGRAGARRRRSTTPSDAPASTTKTAPRSNGARRPSSAPTQAPKRAGGAAQAPVDDKLRFEYSPEIDGDPDPGEVVWTWVPYEDDPSQGKDRPVVIVGRFGTAALAAVALTSKHHGDDHPVGTGSWDPQRRPSYAKVDRILRVDHRDVRREGAILERTRFDELVKAVVVSHRRR